MAQQTDEEKAEEKAGPVPWYKDWTFWIATILSPILIIPAIVTKEVYNKEYFIQFIVWCGRVRWMTKHPEEPMLKVVHEYDKNALADLIERFCKISKGKYPTPHREYIEKEVKEYFSHLRDVKPLDHKLYKL